MAMALQDLNEKQLNFCFFIFVNKASFNNVFNALNLVLNKIYKQKFCHLAMAFGSFLKHRPLAWASLSTDLTRHS
jgi:hypothetical protein